MRQLGRVVAGLRGGKLEVVYLCCDQYCFLVFQHLHRCFALDIFRVVHLTFDFDFDDAVFVILLSSLLHYLVVPTWCLAPSFTFTGDRQMSLLSLRVLPDPESLSGCLFLSHWYSTANRSPAF